MNINYYYEKLKKIKFAQQKKKYFTHHKCGPARRPIHKMEQVRKVNPKLNYGTDQPDLHFADQNVNGPKWTELICFAI